MHGDRVQSDAAGSVFINAHPFKASLVRLR